MNKSEKRIDFKVSPYALYDVVKAIVNQNCSKYHFEVNVSKEDDELIVFITKVNHYNDLSSECTSSYEEPIQELLNE